MCAVLHVVIRLLRFAPALLALGGCTLYQPTLPTTSLIREKGQLEASIGLRPPAVEGGAVYSPIRHMQVAAAGSLIHDDSAPDSTYDFTRSQQAEVSAGYYTDSQRRNWHFSALGGVGRGSGRVHGTQDFGPVVVSGFPSGAPGPSPRKPDWRGTYQKYFGQFGIAHLNTTAGNSHVVTGGVLRATWVDFTRLTRNEQPSTRPQAFYLEPVWFWRFGVSWLQAQATVGLSLPTSRLSHEQKYLLSNNSVLLGGSLLIVPGGRRRAKAH